MLSTSSRTDFAPICKERSDFFVGTHSRVIAFLAADGKSCKDGLAHPSEIVYLQVGKARKLTAPICGTGLGRTPDVEVTIGMQTLSALL